MREIKFRAWRKSSQQMYSWPSLVAYLTECRADIAATFEGESDGDLVLMQFTGLHDKNGKEIYEGDIVRFKDFQCFRDDIYECIEPVTYYCEPNNRVGFDPMVWHTVVEDGYYNSEREDYEVIGNIYENGDLLT